MNIQTIELHGVRYVILPEREFQELQRSLSADASNSAEVPASGRFREVVPLKVDGIPASELLISDRR